MVVLYCLIVSTKLPEMFVPMFLWIPYAFLIDVLYSSLTILNSARVPGVKDAKFDCCKLLSPFIRSSGDFFFQSKMYVSQHSFQSILMSYFAFMIVYHTKHTLILASMLVFFYFSYMRFYFPFWLLIVNAVSKDARLCLLFYCYCCNSRLAALSPGRPLCFSSYSFELREFKLCIINLSCSKVKEIVRSFHVNDNSWFRIPRPFVQMVLDSAVWDV